MQNRFVVPQFIDEEAKIMGPVTGRQFIILLVCLGVDFIIFKLADFALFLLICIPLTMFALILAFLKVRGQKFHFFLLNFVMKMRRPDLRVWDKATGDFVPIVLKDDTPAKGPTPIKAPLMTSRLNELSLVVNTGGMYKPDEE